MHRKALRDAMRAGLIAHPRFAMAEYVPAWTQGVSERTLPAMGVLTPKEVSETVAWDTTSRVIDLSVAVKRQGGATIEDEMDADAAAIEAVATAVLVTPLVITWHLAETTMHLDGSGGTRTGAVILRFSALIHTSRED